MALRQSCDVSGSKGFFKTLRNRGFGGHGGFHQRNPIAFLAPEPDPLCAFRKAGYQTAFIGAWHLGDLPGAAATDNGFTLFHGLPWNPALSPASPLVENTTQLDPAPDPGTLLDTLAEAFLASHAPDPFLLIFHPPSLPATGSSLLGAHGHRIEALDILPTAFALAGEALPGDRSLDGRDIRPFLNSPTFPGTVADFEFIYTGASDNQVYGARKGPWKLHTRLYSQTGDNHGFTASVSSPLLFNVEQDPHERFDRADREPAAVAELQSLRQAFLDSLASEGTFWD